MSNCGATASVGLVQGREWLDGVYAKVVSVGLVQGREWLDGTFG